MRATAPRVVRHPDRDALAAATAARLLVRLQDALATRGRAGAVLTGGGVGTEVVRQLAASPAARAVDWARVDLWWGDERFVPFGSDDRNERQARAAGLDALAALPGGGLPPGRVHAMPASDGPDGDDAAAAARRYAAELARVAAEDGVPGPVPVLDVVLLGVGPDGHVASLFPGHPAVDLDDPDAVVAVHEAPKPPPTRLSLTLPVITSASEVWLVVAGEDKAGAVAASVEGPGDLPASRARGTDLTLWLVDDACAPPPAP